MTFSTVDQLKTPCSVGLDSGTVNHIGRFLALVWVQGKVIRWGYQSNCGRLIESRRMNRAYTQARPVCVPCRIGWRYPVMKEMNKTRHHGVDIFYLYEWVYDIGGIGVYTGGESRSRW